jgi:hypothetical protein
MVEVYFLLCGRRTRINKFRNAELAQVGNDKLQAGCELGWTLVGEMPYRTWNYNSEII